MGLSRVRLSDGTRAWCLERFEALALDAHVAGYLDHGIEVQRGDVVLDVGANIGLFALRLLQRLGGDVTVLAFEPVPAIHAALAKNLAPYASPRVHALPYALGAERGEMTVTFYPSGPALSTAHPSLLAGDAAQLRAAVRGGARHAPKGMRWGAALPDAVLGLIARRLVRGAQEVRCEVRTVSEVIAEHALPRVDLLKVDVEGAELDVLRGVRDEDWPRVRQVVAEVHDIDGRLDLIVSMLRDRGFTRVITARDPAFRETSLHNLFATQQRDRH